MCIGIPMQVIEMRGTFALCEADGKQALVDMMLVGEQAKDTWILNFLGGAREVLSPEYAQQVRLALQAMGDISQGQHQIEHLFADLLNREPSLPEHLHKQLKKHSFPKQNT